MQFSSYFQFRRSSFTFIFVNDVSSIQFSSTFTFVDASFVLLARKILSMQSFTVHLVPISTFMENTCSNSTSTTSTARRTQQQATNVHFFLQQPNNKNQLSHFHHLFPNNQNQTASCTTISIIQTVSYHRKNIID